MSAKRYRIITVCCAATTFLLSTVALSQSFTSDRYSTNAGLARVTQEICDNPGDCPYYLLVEPYQNSELESSEE